MRVTSRTVTLRSPLVRLSPWKIRFMCSLRGFTHIGMSLRSTVLPCFRIWMPSRTRWPSFTPTRIESRSSWLTYSLFTLRHRHRHRHRHRSDSQGRISVPLFHFLALRTLSVFNWGRGGGVGGRFGLVLLL